MTDGRSAWNTGGTGMTDKPDHEPVWVPLGEVDWSDDAAIDALAHRIWRSAVPQMTGPTTLLGPRCLEALALANQLQCCKCRRHGRGPDCVDSGRVAGADERSNRGDSPVLGRERAGRVQFGVRTPGGDVYPRDARTAGCDAHGP